MVILVWVVLKYILTLQTCAGRGKELGPSVPTLSCSCPQGGHVLVHVVSHSSHIDPEDGRVRREREMNRAITKSGMTTSGCLLVMAH